ncbi:hypothetical protein HKX48_007436 [Thoreauomyces humboldtii]|nr:hypothetical protein HKX48_007436 [Thoreauomyces humboldtii]
MDPSSSGNSAFQPGETDPALLDAFKTAAHTVTQLYRESTKQQRRGYEAGYGQCLQDLWQFVSAQRAQGRETLVLGELVSFFAAKHEALRSSSSLAENAPPMNPDATASAQEQRQNIPIPTGQTPGQQALQQQQREDQQARQTQQDHAQQQQLQQQQQQQNVTPPAPTSFSFAPSANPPTTPGPFQFQPPPHQQSQPGQRSYGLVPAHLAPSMQQSHATNPAGQYREPEDVTSFQSNQQHPQHHHHQQIHVLDPTASPLKRRWTGARGDAGVPTNFAWNDPFTLEPAYKRSRRREHQDDNDEMSD